MNTTECILTGRTVEYQNHEYCISYHLSFCGNTVTIFVCRECKRKFKGEIPKHVVCSLIADGRWPERTFIISDQHQGDQCPANCEIIYLPSFFSTGNFPKTPEEKMNSFFIRLYNFQEVDGYGFGIDCKDETIWRKSYFKNDYECLFYLIGLRDKGWIRWGAPDVHPYKGQVHITHAGLNAVVDLTTNGHLSNDCFIAMAFNDSTIPYREAIKKAISQAGFNSVIIDETNIRSDQTIPDSILAAIKKSRFCIADFSHHRNGVYFESGYALGLGRPVIYTCERKEFENAHFDIKQLQHILYETPEELERSLVDKIDAWIK